MKDVLMFIMMIAVLVFGYFAVDRFGKFMDGIYRTSYKQHGNDRNAQIIMADGKDSVEIETAVERFRSEHGQNAAIICISEDSECYDELTCRRESWKIGIHG